VNVTLNRNVLHENFFRERVKTSWGRDLMLLKGLLESRHHHRIYMNKTKQFKEGFSAFSGLHEGLVLLKDLSKPSMPNRTYNVKII
jgi:hypothetical protein